MQFVVDHNLHDVSSAHDDADVEGVVVDENDAH